MLRSSEEETAAREAEESHRAPPSPLRRPAQEPSERVGVPPAAAAESESEEEEEEGLPPAPAPAAGVSLGPPAVQAEKEEPRMSRLAPCPAPMHPPFSPARFWNRRQPVTAASTGPHTATAPPAIVAELRPNVHRSSRAVALAAGATSSCAPLPSASLSSTLSSARTRFGARMKSEPASPLR